MAFIAFRDSGLKPVQDHETLSAIFKVAANVFEPHMASIKARTLLSGAEQDNATVEKHVKAQEVHERYFAQSIQNLKIVTLLPELHGDALSRVLGIMLIDWAYQASTYDNTTPLATLNQMKAATEQSPHKDFYHAAIDELTGEYTGKTWPETSVAEAEYRISFTLSNIHLSKWLLDRAEFLLAGHPNIHPKELANRQKMITQLTALSPNDVPETLHTMAQGYAKRLQGLKP